MSLDLNKLSNKLDEALNNETNETLNKFLNDKRMENNKQTTPVVVKQSTGVAINTENVSPELLNYLTQNFDHDEDDYFGVIGMDNGSEEHKSLMESMSKMGMECRKGDNNAK